MGDAARKPTYPSAPTIKRMIALAKSEGIKVGGFEVDPDGTIRILSERGSPAVDDALGRWREKRRA